MLPLRLLSDPRGDLEVLCLGAHSDDIEIGCAGTLIDLAQAYPSMRVQWVVFSADEVREAEAREAARRIVGRGTEIDVCRFRDGYFPYAGAEIKDYFETLKSRVKPNLIFTHTLSDRHQDHRTISELTWNTFRDHLIFEYEIAKYEGDLGHPNVFITLSDGVARQKVSIIRDVFASQRDKTWFSEQTFWSLLRLRGIECNAPSGYAEAFHCSKVLLGFA